MNLENKVNDQQLDTTRRMTDMNPFSIIEGGEIAKDNINSNINTTNNFGKVVSDTMFATFDLGLKNLETMCSFFGMVSTFKKPIKEASKFMEFTKIQTTRFQTTINQVTKRIEAVKLPVHLMPIFQTEHGKLQRATLWGESRKYNENTPIFFTIPVMRGPELLLLQNQSKPDELGSVIKAALQDGFDVYLTDWKEPNKTTKHHGFREYMDTTHKMTHKIKEFRGQAPMGAHICNYGYMALMALGENPQSMFPNVLAGAPINIVDSNLATMAKETSMRDVDKMLRANNWKLRGKDMTRLWKYGTSEDRYSQIMAPLEIYLATGKDGFDPEKYDKFNRWLHHGVRDVPGTLYREIFELVFKENLLMEPKGILGIDLKQYTEALGLLIGGADDISPRHQCIAAFDVAGTPKHLQQEWLVDGSGHSGIYMSTKSVENYWRKQIFPWMTKMRQQSEAINLYN